MTRGVATEACGLDVITPALLEPVFRSAHVPHANQYHLDGARSVLVELDPEDRRRARRVTVGRSIPGMREPSPRAWSTSLARRLRPLPAHRVPPARVKCAREERGIAPLQDLWKWRQLGAPTGQGGSSAVALPRAVAARHNSAMTLAELLELQAMALPPEERKKLAAKLLASAGASEERPHRRAGSAAGRVHLAPDFDAPLEDFAASS